MEAFTFQCSICGDNSRKLCIFCTKDACKNHLCERCHRCSDCCLCDVPANAPETPALTVKNEEPSLALNLPGENGERGDLYLPNGTFNQQAPY